MKKRIIATLSAVLAVILLLFTSAFASSAADDGLKNVDGKWIYVKDGVKDTSFTSLVKYYGTWYYVENGELNWSFTGLTDYYGTKYYVENGVLNWDYTGLALLGSDEWYYAENGAVKNDYTGLTYFCGRWFYVEKSALNWDYTGLTNYYGTWYYVENSILNWNFTGLTDYYGTKYYVENGVLNWNYTGLALLGSDEWYYAENGAVKNDYTGLTYFCGRWFYVEKSALNWDFTGLTDYYGTKYYVENSVLNWDYTGLALFGSDKWYYAENGTVKNDYTGLVHFGDRWLYVEKSAFNRDYTGLTNYYGTWYYVEKSVLNWSYTGLTKYYDTWYYVENGVLNWNFSGAVLYGKTLYYVNGGRITWDYNGTADYNGVKYIFVGSIAQNGIYKSKYTDYNLVYADGKTGWYDYGDNTYYIGSDGRPLCGNQYIDGKRYFFNANGAKASLFGADFSKHQGTIDWASVKQSGVEFVILRAAVRGYGSSGNLMTDSQIAANIEGALSQNIDVGIYVFSQAVTTEEAVEEAERALDIIKGYDIKLPIYFDSEYSGAPNRTGRADGLTKAERTSLAIAFCETVRNAGYKPGVYASKSFFYNNLGYAAFQSRGYEIWLAHYISSVTDFKYPYNIWQYTSKGSIGGVQSEYADLDIAYYDYANDSDMSERGKNVMVTASSDDFLSFVNTEEKITRYIKTGLASDKEEALRAALLVTNQNASKALIDAINKLN
ncbi:MAG: GH25 family lysozyme [Acutalibacteraceae bacterium]|jgi:GH25 family lysozyme M1 (1,4-beta-N-acetylmuramidase)